MKRLEKGIMLLEHKLFDNTVLQYQAILEMVDKILSFTRHSFRNCQDLFCNRKFNNTRPLCSSDFVNSLVLADFGITSCAVFKRVL